MVVGELSFSSSLGGSRSRSEAGKEEGPLHAAPLDLDEVVPHKYLAILLAEFSHAEAVSKVERMEEALDELCQLEQLAEEHLLEEIFTSGEILTHGKAKDGAPLFWARAWNKRGRGSPSPVEYILYFLWVFIHTKRQQIGNDEPNPVFILDCRGRTLDVGNIDLLSRLSKIMYSLYPVARSSRQFLFCRPKHAELLSESMLPLMSESCPLFTNDQILLEELISDQDCVPSFFRNEESTSQETTIDSLIDFSLVLDKRGFQCLTLDSVHSGYSPSEHDVGVQRTKRKVSLGGVQWVQDSGYPSRSSSYRNTLGKQDGGENKQDGGNKRAEMKPLLNLTSLELNETNTNSTHIGSFDEDWKAPPSIRGLDISVSSRDLLDEAQFGIPSVRSMARTRSRWCVSPMSPAAPCPEDDQF